MAKGYAPTIESGCTGITSLLFINPASAFFFSLFLVNSSSSCFSPASSLAKTVHIQRLQLFVWIGISTALPYFPPLHRSVKTVVSSTVWKRRCNCFQPILWRYPEKTNAPSSRARNPENQRIHLSRKRRLDCVPFQRDTANDLAILFPARSDESILLILHTSPPTRYSQSHTYKLHNTRSLFVRSTENSDRYLSIEFTTTLLQGSISQFMNTMPQRLPRNPFASSNSSAVVIPPSEGPTSRRSSTSKANRLTQFFAGSPKSKEQQTAQAALLSAIAAQQQHLLNNPSPVISAPSLALPTISLSTAKAGEANMDEPPTTLFQPPSVAEAKRQARMDAQFGPIGHSSHRYVSKHVGEDLEAPVIDEPPYYYILTTYISYLVLIIFGHVRDFFGKRFRPDHYKHLKAANGYAALNSDFDNFYVRRLKLRIDDCFARPITGVPGRYVTLMDRKTDDFNEHFQFTGTYTETLNMSSYNYLGFAQSEGPCADAVEETIKKYGISAVSPRADAGTLDLAVEVENQIAKFVGKPAAMVFSMGFATNATSFPALVGKGSLIISDELNHASIRIGARLSGAMISSFKHNDMEDLEDKLREVISQGQPRTHRPWKKILVVVEGLYSMEGTMCNLPGILKLKKKYKFNLFVDEAHSIGALGPRGRGVCDYFGIDPSEIDILMGTLTKSFGANGGYVAAEKHIIDKLRSTNAATIYGESPTPPVLMQILSALKMITGELAPGQGEERLQRIAFNSRYLRLGLKRLGYIVYGHDDSPIIPIMLYNPAKMPAFSHEMLRRKISVVIVGYPATPLITSRARFCVSAAHNKDDLDRLLAACDEVGDVLQLKFSTGIAGGADHLPDGVTPEMEKEWQRANGLQGAIKPPRWSLREVIANGVKDVQEPLR